MSAWSLACIQSLNDLCALGLTSTFTRFRVGEFDSSVKSALIIRSMYSTEHSMPMRVEWPDGRVFGPVRRKRFGKDGTQTLGRCRQLEAM